MRPVILVADQDGRSLCLVERELSDRPERGYRIVSEFPDLPVWRN